MCQLILFQLYYLVHSYYVCNTWSNFEDADWCGWTLGWTLLFQGDTTCYNFESWQKGVFGSLTSTIGTSVYTSYKLVLLVDLKKGSENLNKCCDVCQRAT